MGFSFWFPRLFPLPFILVGGLVLWIGSSDVYNGKASETWPQVSGEIIASSVSSSRSTNSSRTNYHANVRYRFLLNDQKYIGDRVSYRGDDSGAPSLAEAVVKRYPPGKAVKVYYKPDQPGESVLEPGIILVDALWVPGIGLLFFGVGCVMALMLPKMMQDV